MKTTLQKIVDYKKEELASIRRKVPLRDVQLKVQDQAPAIPFLSSFIKGEVNIIAEIKKASPSLGVIREDFRPLDIALIYQDNGAKALSILTDNRFFQGSLEILTRIKENVSLPVLRKDFTLSDYHIFEARGAGADAVLLIAAILDSVQLKDYYDLAKELNMTCLIEIHDEDEWDKVSRLNPDFIGVNNRDLKTFEVNKKTSLTLAEKISKKATRISESGIKTPRDIEELMKAGYDGFLIGETLMKEKDIGKKLRELCLS